MRFFNNTKYKTIPAQELLNDVAHLLINLDTSKIESIELNDKSITVFGVECILLEHKLDKPLKLTGSIRWFDKLSGEGSIRLPSGKSIHFFSCNVNGANSMYPQLVSNVQLGEGEAVQCEISSDPYTFRALGAISIEKVS